MLKPLQWCVRVAGLLALILGLLIGRVTYVWLPRAHMTLGLVVVVALILIAKAGFLARIPKTLPAVAVLWAALTLYIGIAQLHLMTGDSHWIIEVVHAVLGIGAIGLAEAIGARVARQ